jgi:hypothetical protein
MNIKEQNIKCICDSEAFSINLNKVESMGLVTCKKCEKNYFLLDSGDYWYDSIQEKYPPKVKCSKCKSEFFGLRLIYKFRENSEDVMCVEITGLCKQCGSSKKLGIWEFKYSPTDSLIQNPIIFCQNPKIKYDLSTNTCYWTSGDLVNFLEFLYSLNLLIYSKFHENKELVIKGLEKTETIKLAVSLKYSEFFAYKKKLSISNDQKIDWKKEEVISISFPYNMIFGKIGENPGLLFYIKYSTNYIDDFKSGTVKEKSSEFKEIVKKVESWLMTNYPSLRGKNSFDNLQEHKRLFGDRFLKK